MLDFRKIPASIIPVLSEDIQRFVFVASRKRNFINKEAYNTKMLTAEQDKILKKSLTEK